MSYLGYTGIVSRYLSLIDSPTVLEIGVDRGQTSIPLIHNLCCTNGDFKWVGIDVRIDDCLVEQLAQMSHVRILQDDLMDMTSPEWNCSYVHADSLNIMPKLSDAGLSFDLIMIDGDHNYETVSLELECASNMAFGSTLILVDDYSGKWEGKDLFYKDRNTHAENSKLRDLKPGVKQGVNNAVDDWLADNPEWTMINEKNDCVILHQKPLDMQLIHYTNVFSDSGFRLKASGERFIDRFKEQTYRELRSGNFVEYVTPKKTRRDWSVKL
jgi:hypothetical protein